MIAVPAFAPAELLSGLGVPVRRITSDSRRVEPGDAFAAYPGEATDGRRFIPQAIARGAGSVIWEASGFRWNDGWTLPNAPVAGLKQRLGEIADWVYGQPSRELQVVGVTGTNGKTSCAHWIAQCFERLERRAALAGTLGNGFLSALEPAENTTADAALLHERLARWRAQGARVVAMEVSSHGLDQGRVNGVRFAVALFTNLSRDHLDYHGTMEAYGAAKAKLFAWPGLKAAVVNADDAFGAEILARRRNAGQSVLSYGMGEADIAGEGLVASAAGITLRVRTPWGRGELIAPVLGEFNAWNLLGVLGVLLASGVELGRALEALADCEPVPGRLERLGGAGRPLVVVDYAHSPDALGKALAALRAIVPAGGALACVFGCGGERDPGKRPLMGAIAADSADRVVVTSDNPRGEPPEGIIAAILRGVPAAARSRVRVEPDRARAIEIAVASAAPADVVLLAGKGHEDYQEIAGRRLPFDDVEHARSALARWRLA